MARFTRDLLVALAKAIDDEWDSRGFSTDAIKDAPKSLTGKRSQAYDRGLTEAVVMRAAKKRCSANQVAKILFADTHYMKNASVNRLAPYMAACWRIWQDSEDLIITCASDAGDFGHPREETMLYAFSDGRFAAWGAPMVLGERSGASGVKFDTCQI